MEIPRTVTTFGELVDWLIRERHDGKPYRMARALQVSSGLPFQWVHRTVTAPSMDKVARLCEVYELNPEAVWRLLFPMPVLSKPTPPSGGKAPRRTPLPAGARGKKGGRGEALRKLAPQSAVALFVHHMTPSAA
jgi:hypothetical protein